MNKIILSATVAAIISGTALTSCNSNAGSAGNQRDDYRKSLNDSIKNIEAEIDSYKEVSEVLAEEVKEWQRDFTVIANEREAAPYTIYTPAASRYPLMSTGLTARINDSGQFELIATLSGGKAFDRISVTAASNTCLSDPVPNDQALNYRTPTLTTVCFTGAKADSIGRLIADNELNPVSVTYIQGKAVHTWKLTSDAAKCISYTFLYYSAEQNHLRIQKRIPMLYEKLRILREHRGAGGKK